MLDFLEPDPIQVIRKWRIDRSPTFFQVGQALRTVRAERSYRERYGTFARFCRAVFGFSASRAYQLISAATVVENLRQS